MKFKLNLALLFPFILSSCATTGVLVYNPDNLPSEKIARLKSFTSNILEDNHSAYVLRVFNEAGEEVITDAHNKEAAIIPGRYAAVIHCANSGTYAFRRIIFTAQAGESYTAFCKAILGEKNMLGLRTLDGIEAYIVNTKEFTLQMTKDMHKALTPKENK